MASKKMSRDRPKLTIILPAYGEAKNLQKILPKIKKVVASEKINTQILVLDSTSPSDNTAEVCQKFNVTCLPRQGGNRYGDAIRTGIRSSKGEFIITMDADGSHNPEFISQLWNNCDYADVVIASRYIQGGHTDNPWMLVTMSRILNIVFKIVVGMPILDISNSFRLYNGEMLRSISPKFSNFDILEEILALLLWNNPVRPAKIVEIPFHFEQRLYGKPKRRLIIFAMQFLTALFKLLAFRIRSKLKSNSDYRNY